MGIFSKKNIDGDEKDLKKGENGDGGEERTVKVKKIKDLNSGNKKRRREPIRPWGKTDRLFLTALIAVTLGTSSYLALSARGWKLPGVSRFKIPNLNFFGSKTVILESNSQNKKISDEIIGQFEVVTGDLAGTYGLFVINLDNGYEFGVNESKIFQAASLIKLPVMAGMYMAEEDGSLSLSTKYKLQASDKVKGSGSLYGKPVGYEVTYRDLIRLMGKESDNTAFNICRKYLGDEKIQEIISRIGMGDTSLKSNETTPVDVGLFFQKLWNGDLLNESNTKELQEFMTNTNYEKWLAAGVSGVSISHKYGREVGVVNDAGIVNSKHAYIVVVMSKDVRDKEADRVIPLLSEMVYQNMENVD